MVSQTELVSESQNEIKPGRTMKRVSGSAEAVMVFDLGTSSSKGAVYSRDGARLALSSAAYPTHTPAPGFAEQDPRDYLEATKQVARELTGYKIAAIGFSTQTPTLVSCDSQGRALGNAILWQDARAGAEAEWLLQNTTQAARCEWFGMELPVGAATTPAKLLWMRRNRPEVWAAVRWVVQPKDYVAAALTGRFVTDRWCAKGIAHLYTREVHPEWQRLLGKECSPCPPVESIRAVAGTVTPGAAAEWGIPAGTPVSVGWSDALAAVLATGALHHEGRAFVLAGTSEIVGMSRRGGNAAKGLFHVPADVLEVPELSLHYGPTQAGGSCLAWLARLLDKSADQVLDLLDPCPSPILFRPYLQGERTPYWDHTLTAGFEGLRIEHGAPDLVRAVLQGVALQERLVLEEAERGAELGHVVVAGGAARDARWNQLRAHILQRRLLVMEDAEASLRGAALLAWSAVERADPAAMADAWFSAQAIQPSPAYAGQARELMNRFRKVNRS